ncbi:MAG: hypothetical protein DMG71_14400 [Acidobacteria bacterium]|nr:MAG: hypothetical protein DMG71_14400 [Acidobacteriota bacterium]
MKISQARYPIEDVLVRITREIPSSCTDLYRMARHVFSGLLVALLLLATLPKVVAADAQSHDKPEQKTEAQKSTPAVFSEADAARLLAEVQQALEGNNQRRFLRLFDSRRMPNYAAFQDQMAEFFEKYEAFRVRYHITQTSTEDGSGVVLADLELEATPAGAYVPNVRKTAQLRLVTAWDGKAWKIVDWAPRSVLN